MAAFIFMTLLALICVGVWLHRLCARAVDVIREMVEHEYALDADAGDKTPAELLYGDAPSLQEKPDRQA